jgi:hypothetical protein
MPRVGDRVVEVDRRDVHAQALEDAEGSKEHPLEEPSVGGEMRLHLVGRAVRSAHAAQAIRAAASSPIGGLRAPTIASDEPRP